LCVGLAATPLCKNKTNNEDIMTLKEEKNLVPIDSEINDFYSDDDLYNINSWGADLSFRELMTMYEENELIKPELQRKYVWDKPEASRFIESLLLGLPVPSIFLAKAHGEKKLIVDGYQRIMTVYDYVNGIFSKDRKIFKLTNSDKINKRWRNKAFNELTDTEKRKIRSTTIHAIIFEQKHPKDNDTSMYQIFERINTSGRTLTTQEIRNCVYQGNFNSLLFELNKYDKWRDLFGIKEEDSRMRDMEFILRLFALSSNEIKKMKKGQISMKKFLNKFMGYDSSNSLSAIKKIKSDFFETIDFISKYLGETAFQNLSSTDPSKTINRFHPTIFDAIAIATLYALKSGKDINKRNLKRKRTKLLKDLIFKEYTTIRTTNIDHINGRIKLALKELYGLDYE
jgi:uncharacterized protein with ParB-like and HNH nuclease domain